LGRSRLDFLKGRRNGTVAQTITEMVTENAAAGMMSALALGTLTAVLNRNLPPRPGADAGRSNSALIVTCP
jgi:hypothetical protein